MNHPSKEQKGWREAFRALDTPELALSNLAKFRIEAFIEGLLSQQRNRLREAVANLDYCADVEHDGPTGCSDSHWLFGKDMHRVQDEALAAFDRVEL